MKKSYIKLSCLVLSILFIHSNKLVAQWAPVGTGMNSSVGSTLVYNGELYVSGSFTTAGGIAASRIAKWDGTTWSPVGTGMNGTVSVLAEYNNELYAGGTFTLAGGATVNNIAKWNGTSWQSLTSGTNGGVYALKEYNGELYVGGFFSTAGGGAFNMIAKWNGSVWSNVGNSNCGSPIVSFLVHNNELYVGGGFPSIGGIITPSIAKWNGSSWAGVGGGIPAGGGGVIALAVYGTDIIAGGNFTNSTENYIQKWDGTTWSAMGAGLNTGIGSGVYTLMSYNGELYVGGFFATAGGNSVPNLAKWDGSAWSAVGGGVNNQVRTTCIYNSELYAGGSFTAAGGNSTGNYIAKLATTVFVNEYNSQDKIIVYPNPATDHLTIRTEETSAKAELFDMKGSSVICIPFDAEVKAIDISTLTPGVYFLKIITEKGVSVKKIIKN